MNPKHVHLLLYVCACNPLCFMWALAGLLLLHSFPYYSVLRPSVNNFTYHSVLRPSVNNFTYHSVLRPSVNNFTYHSVLRPSVNNSYLAQLSSIVQDVMNTEMCGMCRRLSLPPFVLSRNVFRTMYSITVLFKGFPQHTVPNVFKHCMYHVRVHAQMHKMCSVAC